MEKAQQYVRPAHLTDLQRRELRSIWSGIHWRCRSNHPNYGGRGIGVSQEWSDFEAFARDMGARPSRCHSVDRIDVNKGYSKDNCRWADPKQQAANKRRYPKPDPPKPGTDSNWRIVYVNGRVFRVRPDRCWNSH